MYGNAEDENKLGPLVVKVDVQSWEGWGWGGSDCARVF